MSYSVLLVGATGSIGSKISKQLAIHRKRFSRVAYLTVLSNAGREKEAKYTAIDLERVSGGLTNPSSYAGFDIVIFAVGDDLCSQQPEYIDAAFQAGVKHVYPAEFGADLTHSIAAEEPYFGEKLGVRRHLEAVVQKDPSLGHTYVLNGIFADLLLQRNILGLSDDRKTAEFIGLPETLVTTTHSDNVAEVIVTSLLPEHLKSLSGPRTVRYAGSTMSLSEIYRTIGEVGGNEVSVHYTTKQGSYKKEKALEPQEVYGWLVSSRLFDLSASVRRGLCQTTITNIKR